MKNTLEKLGVQPTQSLQTAVAEHESELKNFNPDQTPIKNEPPQWKTTGNLDIKILTSASTSKELMKKLDIKKGKIAQQGGGHDRIVWDRHFADQIHEAKKKFYQLLDDGYKAFLTREDGTPCSRAMTAFDPNAEEIVMIAPIRAG